MSDRESLDHPRSPSPQFAEELVARFRELQSYVGWTDADAHRLSAAAPLLEPTLPDLVDEFYEEIQRHPSTARVITGGPSQIDRLKRTLHRWLRELLNANYDKAYVLRRWRVGWRHVEIGLDQLYTNAAMARLRIGLVNALDRGWSADPSELSATRIALHRAVDLDLALIESAYHHEHAQRRRQLERLAAIGQMAGGVAHELRQPLNVIQTSIYYLRHTHSASPEKRAEHLQRIESQVGLANRVITALNDFARLPAPRADPVDLHDCVRRTLEETTTPETIPISLSCPEPLPPVLGDGDQLRIAFGNLVRNAVHVLNDGGTLTITCRVGHEHVETIFADTGPGIPPGQIEHIMEPLYTTRARGIGLGLTITRAIVEKHGGDLLVSSAEGRGATFTVRLPAQSSQRGGQ